MGGISFHHPWAPAVAGVTRKPLALAGDLRFFEEDEAEAAEAGLLGARADDDLEEQLIRRGLVADDEQLRDLGRLLAPS